MGCCAGTGNDDPRLLARSPRGASVRSLAGARTAWLLALALGWGALAGAVAVDQDRVRAVASQLRCVVCQNLSVADSPSEMARQMREVIRERLGQGETPEQVIAYFVDKYGEWVLLSPRARGFTLLVWVLPFVGLFAGLGGVLLVAARWTRRAAVAAPRDEPMTPEDRERVRRELDQLGRGR